MALAELHRLAENLSLAYQKTAVEFAARIKPVQDDVQKICVSYEDTCEFLVKETPGADLSYRLEVARVAGKFVLCVGAYKPVDASGRLRPDGVQVLHGPIDSMPLHVKLEVLKVIYAFVDRYVVHVKEQRKALLAEGGA
jgi:hypothetical protein